MKRTYTYTLQDYIDVLDAHGHIGHVGIDPDGDLVWARRTDIVWAHESIVLDWPKVEQYRSMMDLDAVVYSPSPMQRAEFDARQ